MASSSLLSLVLVILLCYLTDEHVSKHIIFVLYSVTLILSDDFMVDFFLSVRPQTFVPEGRKRECV